MKKSVSQLHSRKIAGKTKEKPSIGNRYPKYFLKDWGCISIVECLPRVQETSYLIHNTTHTYTQKT